MNALTVATPASLPGTYEAAKAALAQCERVDECKDWSDKAAALASYAKQAEDDQLERMALRIRGRAVRRAGELLKQFDARDGRNLPNTKKDGGDHFSQKQAAKAAGMSERQTKTAVRVANVPANDFETQIESDKPPTISQLAQQGIKRRQTQPKPKAGTLDELRRTDSARYRKALAIKAKVSDALRFLNEVSASNLDILPDGERQHAVGCLTEIKEAAQTLTARLTA